MNTELSSLLKSDLNHRDSQWEQRFFAQLIRQNGRVLYSQPQNGPDGFPYLLVEITDQPSEPLIQIIDWLSTRGIGLVLNPHQTYPDYVFTFGMLWNFRERGEFLSSSEVKNQARLELEAGQKLWVAQPSSSYLPDYVRPLLKQFLLDQGVLRPRIALISLDGDHYDLAVSLESLGSPKESERMGVAEAVSWFLPAHYSVTLLSEKVISGFADL